MIMAKTTEVVNTQSTATIYIVIILVIIVAHRFCKLKEKQFGQSKIL